MLQIRNTKCVKKLTYIDAGCRGVEFLPRNGFIRAYDGFNREGLKQIRLFEFPFDTSRPEIARRQEQNKCGCTLGFDS